MDCLDGLHVHQRFVQVHCWRCKLGNLGKGSLTWFLLLGATTTWEVVQVHNIGYWLRLPFPSLDGSHLDQWGCCNILVPTGHCFLFIFLHCSYPYDEENQLKKKKKKRKEKRKYMKTKWSRPYLRRWVVSSWPRFSAVGTGLSPQAARRLRVTK